MAIRLIEEGKLSENSLLSKWLPTFPRGDEITVEQLLRHGAGIPHRVTTEAEETHPHTAANMVSLAARKPLLFDPGTDTVYSSAGYSVLARVLELAGGRSYSELLEDLVLAPAGAVHTIGRADSRHPLAGRAQGLFLGPDGPLNAPLKDLSFLVGAGSVYSTPRDLLAIQRAVLDGTYDEGTYELGHGSLMALDRRQGPQPASRSRRSTSDSSRSAASIAAFARAISAALGFLATSAWWFATIVKTAVTL